MDHLAAAQEIAALVTAHAEGDDRLDLTQIATMHAAVAQAEALQRIADALEADSSRPGYPSA